jgi:hypothetical protein
LSNLHHTRMNLALSNSLLGLLLHLPKRDWNKIIADAERKNNPPEQKEKPHHDKPPSRELGGYTGTYEHAAYGTVRITLNDGKLIWQWHRFRAALTHYQDDIFSLPIEIIGEPRVVFTLDAGGTVARMKVLGNMDVEFQRRR